MFVDNSGVDIVLGVFPFVKELLCRGTMVNSVFRYSKKLILLLKDNHANSRNFWFCLAHKKAKTDAYAKNKRCRRGLLALCVVSLSTSVNNVVSVSSVEFC